VLVSEHAGHQGPIKPKGKMFAISQLYQLDNAMRRVGVEQEYSALPSPSAKPP
jgi:hypothetical protein